jgi:hypothetical protein
MRKGLDDATQAKIGKIIAGRRKRRAANEAIYKEVKRTRSSVEINQHSRALDRWSADNDACRVCMEESMNQLRAVIDAAYAPAN